MTKQETVDNRPLFTCLTNIPNYYRLHEFEYLYRELSQHGIDFEVIFMSKTEPGRHWTYCPKEWSFRSFIASGLHPNWNNLAFHINPWIVPRILKRPPTWLLIGGGWMIPTVISVAESIRVLLPKTYLLYWAEATRSYTKYSRSGWRRSLRRAALSAYDGFVVPGKKSVEYLEELFDKHLAPVLWLPNYVDENDYLVRVKQLRSLRRSHRKKMSLDNRVVFLLPARLIPEKGILPFLASLINVQHERFILLLAGDGPLEEEILKFINCHEMHQVRLMGHQNLAHLLKLYALSDALVLPSLREPYGFVAVEALWAGLPLVLSREIGALPEVLEEGENGWSFNPYNQNDILRVMELAVSAGPSRLAEMGLKSQQIAQERFATMPSVSSFVSKLLRIFPTHNQ